MKRRAAGELVANKVVTLFDSNASSAYKSLRSWQKKTQRENGKFASDCRRHLHTNFLRQTVCDRCGNETMTMLKSDFEQSQRSMSINYVSKCVPSTRIYRFRPKDLLNDDLSSQFVQGKKTSFPYSTLNNSISCLSDCLFPNDLMRSPL